MAATRPVVQVTQTFASPTVTVATPDLNCIVIGPCYNVQDYNATNKSNIELSTVYGSLNGSCGTTGALATAPVAIVTAEPPNNTSGAILDSDSVSVILDDVQARIAIGGDGVRVENSTTFTSAAGTFVASGVKAGDRIVITDPLVPVTVEKTVASVTSATVLELTSNLNAAGTDIDGAAYTGMALTGLDYRIERTLNDKTVGSAFVTVSGQQVTLGAGVTVSDTTESLTDAVVDYAKVYIQYRSLRQDLTSVGELSSASAITGTLGGTDERNPLATGVSIALQNTSSPVQYLGITGDNLNDATDRLTAYTVARDTIESRKDVYAIVPLANETTILSLFKTHVVNLADPTISNFRIAIGSSTLPTTKVISAASAVGADEIVATDPIVIFVDPTATFVTDSVGSTDTLVISGSALSGSYEIRRALAETILEIDGAAGSDVDFPSATTTALGWTIGAKASNPAATATSRRRISRILDNTATFITDGVAVGDLVEIPADGGSDFTTTLNSYAITQVVSENRVEVDVDTGTGSEIELPSTSGGVAVDSAFDYRISRTLSKADQVTELNAVTSSLSHSRMVMVWPDSCKVSGVTNALTGVQGDSPGYYLACAVGGMVAGYPAHQNFTNLGIGGIDSVTNSSRYFTEAQIDSLSSGGWYVMVQDTPTALPYSVHALTSDTTTLESGELMVVKNFDYVSIFYKNLLVQFLNGYNVLPETLDLIKSAFDAGTAQLKSRRYPKIGPSILDGAVQSISTVDGAADQVELYTTVTLPKPLNQIGLFLTA